MFSLKIGEMHLLTQNPPKDKVFDLEVEIEMAATYQRAEILEKKRLAAAE